MQGHTFGNKEGRPYLQNGGLESSDSEKNLEVIVGKQLNTSFQCNALTNRANAILGSINKGVGVGR